MKVARGAVDVGTNGYRASPSYRYRHRLYRRALRRTPVSPFLEVGAGRGEVAAWLAARGATGVALEPSPRAAALARAALAPFDAMEVVEQSLEGYNDAERFNLVVMNEILEHVEDDGAAVKKAASLLRPEGSILLSVPAHRSQWGWRDVAKGHLRRYDRADVEGLLSAAGLTPSMFWSWGWPVINLLRWSDRNKRVTAGRVAAATAASAVTADVPRGAGAFSAAWLWATPFVIMDLFLGGDAGVGYVVVARKAGTTAL